MPTIYFSSPNNLIATAHSIKAAMSTVGDIFCEQVVDDTVKNLSKQFGEVLHKYQSLTINRNDKSSQVFTQEDSLILQSKISTLAQGLFVSVISDNCGERINQKIFHAEIVVDSIKVSAETVKYQQIPIIAPFTDVALRT